MDIDASTETNVLELDGSTEIFYVAYRIADRNHVSHYANVESRLSREGRLVHLASKLAAGPDEVELFWHFCVRRSATSADGDSECAPHQDSEFLGAGLANGLFGRLPMPPEAIRGSLVLGTEAANTSELAEQVLHCFCEALRKGLVHSLVTRFGCVPFGDGVVFSRHEPDEHGGVVLFRLLYRLVQPVGALRIVCVGTKLPVQPASKSLLQPGCDIVLAPSMARARYLRQNYLDPIILRTLRSRMSVSSAPDGVYVELVEGGGCLVWPLDLCFMLEDAQEAEEEEEEMGVQEPQSTAMASDVELLMSYPLPDINLSPGSQSLHSIYPTPPTLGFSVVSSTTMAAAAAGAADHVLSPSRTTDGAAAPTPGGAMSAVLLPSRTEAQSHQTSPAIVTPQAHLASGPEDEDFEVTDADFSFFDDDDDNNNVSNARVANAPVVAPASLLMSHNASRQELHEVTPLQTPPHSPSQVTHSAPREQEVSRPLLRTYIPEKWRAESFSGELDSKYADGGLFFVPAPNGGSDKHDASGSTQNKKRKSIGERANGSITSSEGFGQDGNDEDYEYEEEEEEEDDADNDSIDDNVDEEYEEDEEGESHSMGSKVDRLGVADTGERKSNVTSTSGTSRTPRNLPGSTAPRYTKWDSVNQYEPGETFPVVMEVLLNTFGVRYGCLRELISPKSVIGINHEGEKGRRPQLLRECNSSLRYVPNAHGTENDDGISQKALLETFSYLRNMMDAVCSFFKSHMCIHWCRITDLCESADPTNTLSMRFSARLIRDRHALYPVTAPKVHIRRNRHMLECESSVLRFWPIVNLSPLSEPVDVHYVVINGTDTTPEAAQELESVMSEISYQYASCGFGRHDALPDLAVVQVEALEHDAAASVLTSLLNNYHGNRVIVVYMAQVLTDSSASPALALSQLIHNVSLGLRSDPLPPQFLFESLPRAYWDATGRVATYSLCELVKLQMSVYARVKPIHDRASQRVIDPPFRFIKPIPAHVEFRAEQSGRAAKDILSGYLQLHMAIVLCVERATYTICWVSMDFEVSGSRVGYLADAHTVTEACYGVLCELAAQHVTVPAVVNLLVEGGAMTPSALESLQNIEARVFTSGSEHADTGSRWVRSLHIMLVDSSHGIATVPTRTQVQTMTQRSHIVIDAAAAAAPTATTAAAAAAVAADTGTPGSMVGTPVSIPAGPTQSAASPSDEMAGIVVDTTHECWIGVASARNFVRDFVSAPSVRSEEQMHRVLEQGGDLEAVAKPEPEFPGSSDKSIISVTPAEGALSWRVAQTARRSAFLLARWHDEWSTEPLFVVDFVYPIDVSDDAIQETMHQLHELAVFEQCLRPGLMPVGRAAQLRPWHLQTARQLAADVS